MRVMLVASGGGHLRQILSIARAFDGHELLLASNRSSLSESVTQGLEVTYITAFAFGMYKETGFWEYGRRFIACAVDAWRAVRRFRPDVIVSTGASLAFFCFVAGRLTGRHLIFVESVARIDAPSLAGRFVYRLADICIVQWPGLLGVWPRAVLCPSVKMSSAGVERERRLTFVTVGASLPFDRMLRGVGSLMNRGRIPGQVVIQAGDSAISVPGADSAPFMSQTMMREQFEKADLVITHAGTGSIFGALEAGCRVVVMPRSARLGEHFDDHQFEIADAFHREGIVEVARDESELEAAVASALTKPARKVIYDGEAIGRLILRRLHERFPETGIEAHETT